MLKILRFYLKVLKLAARDEKFRAHAFAELWSVVRQYLPARLVTPRRDYVFCRYLTSPVDNPLGRWLPPVGIGYRLSAYGILFDEQGRALFGSDEKMNFGWNLPGGGINKDETLEQGLIREFEEETGLIVKVGPVVHNQDNFVIMPTGRPVHAVMHYYLVEVVGGELLEAGNGFDTSRVAFIDLATVPPGVVVDFAAVTALIVQAQRLREALKLT